uniref:Uncharacterized protein n=1 Tax=Triticum urartu TaxID=4572 RepID=A0A8R7PKI1_TRIUA
MAREEGSPITANMALDERAAKHAVAAGASASAGKVKRCHRASTEKRPLRPCAAKRKAEADDDDELLAAKKKAFYTKSGPSRKMKQLPRAEVASILSSRTHPDRAPSCYKALKLQNTDLIPSPEEEMDELKVAEYADARDFYEAAEEFSRFQAWVRSEYAKYGYVEVDDDYLAHREQVRACSDTAREAALEAMDFSDGDEDLKMFFRNRRH